MSGAFIGHLPLGQRSAARRWLKLGMRRRKVLDLALMRKVHARAGGKVVCWEMTSSLVKLTKSSLVLSVVMKNI